MFNIFFKIKTNIVITILTNINYLIKNQLAIIFFLIKFVHIDVVMNKKKLLLKLISKFYESFRFYTFILFLLKKKTLKEINSVIKFLIIEKQLKY